MESEEKDKGTNNQSAERNTVPVYELVLVSVWVSP